MTNDSDPVTLPAEVGAKLTLKVLLAPGAMVKGVDSPEVPKPLPETPAEETVRLAVPVFLSKIVCEALVPIRTLPKLTLDGVARIAAWVMVTGALAKLVV